MGNKKRAIKTSSTQDNFRIASGRSKVHGGTRSLIVLARRVRISFPRWTELVPVYAIGTIATFWVIQRSTFEPISQRRTGG
jgi:hypothetical protein